MTPEEREAMQHLVDFWNAYIKLIGNDQHSVTKVMHAMHEIQGVMAIRVMRRQETGYWRR